MNLEAKYNNLVYVIDEYGFFVKDEVLTKENEKEIKYVSIQPKGFYKPKWDGEKWVEGKTEEEFLEEEFFNALNPTSEEITKAERELEVIELLLEMGLIQ